MSMKTLQMLSDTLTQQCKSTVTFRFQNLNSPWKPILKYHTRAL